MIELSDIVFLQPLEVKKQKDEEPGQSYPFQPSPNETMLICEMSTKKGFDNSDEWKFKVSSTETGRINKDDKRMITKRTKQKNS